jgi:hypothetical protein
MIRRMLRWLDRPVSEPVDPVDRPVYNDKGDLLFTINLARGCVVFPATKERDPHAQ